MGTVYTAASNKPCNRNRVALSIHDDEVGVFEQLKLFHNAETGHLQFGLLLVFADGTGSPRPKLLLVAAGTLT